MDRSDWGAHSRIEELCVLARGLGYFVGAIVLWCLLAGGAEAQSTLRYKLDYTGAQGQSYLWNMPTGRDPSDLDTKSFVMNGNSSQHFYDDQTLPTSSIGLLSYFSGIHAQRRDTCAAQNLPTVVALVDCHQMDQLVHVYDNPPSTNQQLFWNSQGIIYHGVDKWMVVLQQPTSYQGRPSASTDPVQNGTWLVYKWQIYVDFVGGGETWVQGSGQGMNCTWTGSTPSSCGFYAKIVSTTEPLPQPENACKQSDGQPFVYHMPWPVFYNTGTGFYEEIGTEARWPGLQPSHHFYDCKVKRGAPSAINPANGLPYAAACWKVQDPFTTEATGPDKRFAFCTAYSDGDKWPPGEGFDVEVLHPEVQPKQEINVDTVVGGLVNGEPVNVDVSTPLQDYVQDAAFDRLCDPTKNAGVISCTSVGSKIIIVKKINGCQTKEYWHDGNVSGDGQCIGSYDRDWPDPAEPYDPNKGFKWQPGKPADGKDVENQTLTCIGDTGRPVTCKSKEGAGQTIYWPPVTGGGDSSTRPGGTPADGEEGEEAPGSGPGGLPGLSGVGGGDGFYKSTYGEEGLSGIWDGFAGDFASSGFVASVGSMVPPSGNATYDWCPGLWEDASSPLLAQMASNQSWCVPGGWLDIVRVVLTIGTVFASVGAVVGGRWA